MAIDRSLIEEYARGGPRLGEAIASLSREELNAFPVPGTWSIQQIVLHLLDSDLIGADRMKRVIAEEQPNLIGFDESAFARNLFYADLDAGLACELFAGNRTLTVEILRRLPEAAFARTGVHNERGPLTLADLLEAYVGHLEHHLGFIRQKRALLGKELKR